MSRATARCFVDSGFDTSTVPSCGDSAPDIFCEIVTDSPKLAEPSRRDIR